MERRQRVVQNARILAGETLAQKLFQLRHIQIEHPGDEAERVNVFALVLGGAADGLDRERGNRNAHVVIIGFPFRLGRHVVAVVKHDAFFLERTDVAFVAVLVKRQQHVGFVTGGQHLAAADAHLKNGRSAGNGGRNGHERHDFLLAAPGQPREETADGLDAVLRIAGNADDDLVDPGNFFRATRRRRTVSIVSLMELLALKVNRHARWVWRLK